jgi:hypothetical protein
MTPESPETYGQARLRAILETAEQLGWERDPRKAGRWWLPGTYWHFRCDTEECSVYKISKARRGAYQLRKFPIFEVTGIVALLTLALEDRPLYV